MIRKVKGSILRIVGVKIIVLFIMVSLNQGCCTGCDEAILEDNAELVAEYLNGLQIENAVLEAGMPPEANQNIEFALNSNGFAFNDEGFDFIIDSNSDLLGLYLQVKRGDAISGGYYNVQFDEGNSKKPFLRKFTSDLFEKTNKINGAKIFGDYQVDVNFSPALSLEANTSTFGICFLIQAYDTRGNVSEPQEICFDHYGWGNDFALTGLWNLTKYQELEEGVVSSVAIGELVCDDSCNSLEFQSIQFAEDGSFELEIIEYKYEDQNSEPNGRYQENYIGKWLKADYRLFLVVYGFSALENDTQIDNMSLSLGDADILLISEVETLPDEFQPSQMNFIHDNTYTEFYERPKTE